MSGARISAPAGLVLALSLCTGCPKLEKIEQSTASVPTEVQRIFDEACATAGCHDAATRSNGVDLTAAGAGAIIGGTGSTGLPLVTIGDLANSYLAVKVMPDPPAGAPARVGDKMPPTTDLDPVDLAILVGWMAGAPLPSPDTGGTTDMGATSMGESSTGPSAPVECSVEAVDGGGTITEVDRGSDPGQIPNDIGNILEESCGCHYTDFVATGTVPGSSAYPPTGVLDIDTLAGFTSDAGGMTGTQRVLARVVEDAIVPMPPVGCGTSATEPDDNMDPDDRALLIEWLMADTPDGATWDGGAG
jgi:hypothetical protein